MKATRYQIADRRGTAVMEFALSLTFFIPLLLGTLVFGFRLIRSIQMSQSPAISDICTCEASTFAIRDRRPMRPRLRRGSTCHPGGPVN